MGKGRMPRCAALAAATLLFSGAAGAAGGHHSVDDAAILDPGQCELEGWFTRGRDRERLLHAGLNCRLGPVEASIAGEHARAPGEGSATGWGLEAKWATEVAEGWHLGAKIGPAWAAHVRPRHQGTSIVALASWEAREHLHLHLNLGRDLVRRGEDENRYGASLEWAPAKAWSLVGERYKEEGSHFVRAGVRFVAGEHWSIDFSRAHRLTGPGVSAWTLGATWLFDRK